MNVAETNDPVGLHTLEVVANAGRFNHWMYEEFRHFLKGEILEIGSGIGNISKLVIEDGHFITLSDYNSEYCSRLRQIFLGNKNVRDIIRLDLLKNGFEQQYAEFHEKFDSIFLLNVIEHIKDDALALTNCRFLLKPGGHLIVLAPALSWLYCRFDRQLGHYRRYSLKKMKRLLGEENFTVRSASYFNFTGIAGWLLFGKILSRKMLGSSEMSVFDRMVPVAKRLDKLIGKRAGLSIIVTAVKS